MTILPSLISGGAGIAGTAINGAASSKAIRDALAAQNLATDKGIGALNGAFQTNAGLLAPYTNTGSAAMTQLSQLLGLGTPSAAPPAAAALSTTPSYSAYVQNSPDVLKAYNDIGVKQGTSIDKFGEWHWNTFGKNEYDNGGRAYSPYGAKPPAATATDTAASDPGATQAQAAQIQQQSIDQLKNSPIYQSLFHNGEQALLANAAATGGLRGGNTEKALYNLGNDTLAQVMQQQIANLGGVANAGQGASTTLAGQNGNMAQLIASLLGGQGNNAASAGLTGAGVANQTTNQLTSGISSLMGNSGFTGGMSSLLSALGLGGGVKPTGASQFGGPISLGTNGMTMPAFGSSGNPYAINNMMPAF